MRLLSQRAAGGGIAAEKDMIEWTCEGGSEMREAE